MDNIDYDFSRRSLFEAWSRMTGISVEAAEALRRLGESTSASITICASAEYHDNDQSISDIKKRIKHCRNPLERSRLQKQLNDAYKDRKASRVMSLDNPRFRCSRKALERMLGFEG